MDKEVDIYMGNKNRSLQGQLRFALKQRRKARQNSYDKRQQMLEKDIIQQIKEGDDSEKRTKMERILKTIKHSEAKARMYQIFRVYLKPSATSALQFVDVPDYRTLRLLYIACLKTWATDISSTQFVAPWIGLWTIPFADVATFLNKSMPHCRVTEKDALNHHLYNFHVSHFKQAQGSPFTVNPIKTWFGEDLSMDKSKQFNEGNQFYQSYAEIDKATKDVLKELQPSLSDPPKIPIVFSADNVHQGFKIWREGTSTSPHGNNLTLYKAWLRKEKEDDGMSAHRFCQIVATLMNISIQIGKPLSRWKKVQNIYLQKEAGVYRIHRMRMLHIIDCELNLLRREIVTCRLMRNAEAFNYLDDSQYGGRNGRAAINIPLMRAFMYDTFHLSWTNAAVTDCDAKACYDCIVAIVTGLAEIKAGLPPHAASYIIKALKQLEYTMMTAYGESEATNQHTSDDPAHGIGQGPTDAGSGWTFNSDVIIKCFKRIVQGCILNDPMEKLIQDLKLLLFVDDSSLNHVGEKFDTPARLLMQQVQSEVKMWDTYLHTIGQQLELLKSAYSMLIWSFKPDGSPVITPEHDLPVNSVTLMRHGITCALKHKSVNTAPRMLGVHKALNLQEETELTHLKGKASRYRKAVISCPCGAYDVWLSYSTIFIPSISYSFSAIACKEEDFDKMHKQLLPVLLPRLGYHHGFPRAVAFASNDFLGVGLYHLKAFHLALQIEGLIKHIRKSNLVGNTANIMIRWAQHTSGMGQPILEHTKHLPHLEGTWVNDLRSGLYTINGQIILTQPWIRAPMRENDRHVMSIIDASTALTDDEKLICNYCRFIMKVEHISDIVSSDGKVLHPEFNQITQPLHNQKYTLLWPQQQVPNSTSWGIWRKAIRMILCNDNNRLKIPLGMWTRTYKQWTAYHDDNTDIIYTVENDEWREHEVIMKNRRIFQILTAGVQCSRPRKLSRLSPITDLQHIQDTPWSKCTIPAKVHPRKKQPPPASFREYIKTLPPWEKVLLNSLLETAVTHISLFDHIQLGTDLWFVTDGGVTDGIGYFGWVIATATTILWRGKGHSQGHPDLMESLHAESSELLALLRFILRFITYHNLTLNKDIATHYCDNSTVVKRMVKHYDGYINSPTQWLNADMDVHAQILDTLEELKMQLPTRHVKGHQGLRKSRDKLSWQAYLNVTCNDLANAARASIFESKQTDLFYPFPAAKAYLKIDDKYITKSIKHMVMNAWTTQDLQSHLTTKFKWGNHESIQVVLSLDDYKDLMKAQNEETSSSPSGRHYGHYKAALSSDIISQVHATMMSLLFQHGFTPKCWETALNVMLEKDPGKPKITRLRIIVIVEGDMNGMLKVVWNQRLVPKAEETNFFTLFSLEIAKAELP